MLPYLLGLCFCSKDYLDPVPWSWSKTLNLQASSGLDIVQAFLQACLDYNVVCLLSLYPAYINNDYPLILKWLGLCSLPSLHCCPRRSAMAAMLTQAGRTVGLLHSTSGY
jgi:hypothetical protein